MSSGLRLFAIAVEAILKFAVKATLTGIDLGSVGVSLMVIGAAGPGDFALAQGDRPELPRDFYLIGIRRRKSWTTDGWSCGRLPPPTRTVRH
jgi:hypothetical protein